MTDVEREEKDFPFSQASIEIVEVGPELFCEVLVLQPSGARSHLGDGGTSTLTMDARPVTPDGRYFVVRDAYGGVPILTSRKGACVS